MIFDNVKTEIKLYSHKDKIKAHEFSLFFFFFFGFAKVYPEFMEGVSNLLGGGVCVC